INQELIELKNLEKDKNNALDLAQKSYEESKTVYEEQLKLEKNSYSYARNIFCFNSALIFTLSIFPSTSFIDLVTASFLDSDTCF
ncbi:hypothetical protein D1N53_22150, partial [Clostridioides difficile]